MAQRREDRLLRPHRARPRLGSGRDGDARAPAAATATCSTAPSAGSPTARSPTSRSCGPRRTTARSAASSSRRARPASRTRDIHGKFSLRASITSRARLRGLPHPGCENKLPGVNGLQGRSSCLTQARYGIAWGAIGAAHGAATTGRCSTRKQRIQFAQADRPASSSCSRSSCAMITEITKAQLLCLRLGRLKDAGKLRPAAGLDGQAEQRADGARRARASRATSSARTASSTSTRSSATC